MPLRYLQLALKAKMLAIEPFAQLVDHLKRVGEARLEEVLQYVASLGYMEEGARKITGLSSHSWWR